MTNSICNASPDDNISKHVVYNHKQHVGAICSVVWASIPNTFDASCVVMGGDISEIFHSLRPIAYCFKWKKKSKDGKNALKCVLLKCETYVMIFGVDGLVVLVVLALACKCECCLYVFNGILLISFKRLVFIGLF